MERESLEYLQRRELAERAAAKRSPSGIARRIHQELAQRYAELRHSHKAPQQQA